MPSKLLIAAAEAAHHARKAGQLGVNASITIDGRAVMDRVRRERDRFVGFVLESIDGFDRDHMLRGTARFVSPHELLVTSVGSGAETTRVTANTVVIATGSSAFIPPVFDAVRERVIINDDVFSWETLPESVVVFGAGVIGLELGQAFHRLGARVRIFGRGNTVGPLGDPAVKESAALVFKEELSVDFDAKVNSVLPHGDKNGVAVAYVDPDGNDRTESFDAILVAAGRKPNIANLGLENAGIGASAAIDRATLQWGDTHVFVAGDVNDENPLLHEAADEGCIAGTNAALHPKHRPGHRRSGLAIAFTDPPLAVVAGGFAAASQVPGFISGEINFANQGRSRIMLQNHGAARVYADPKTRRFLGAEIAGPRGEHLAHLLAWSHQLELTIDQMLAMPFYHPVVEEGIRTALRDAAVKLDSSSKISAVGRTS
jgi:dihydrolipoamide dehydrogenase